MAVDGRQIVLPFSEGLLLFLELPSVVSTEVQRRLSSLLSMNLKNFCVGERALFFITLSNYYPVQKQRLILPVPNIKYGVFFYKKKKQGAVLQKVLKPSCRPNQ